MRPTSRQDGAMADDTTRVRQTLREAGIEGVEDFGRFVNNTKYFAPSTFDERAAMPVLLMLLPSLTEPKVVEAVARHLRRPWARPLAFQPLLQAFRTWAPREQLAGWAIGDALATSATVRDADVLLDLVTDRNYGKSRQMIVHSLWRFRRDERTVVVLLRLIEDPDISLHAMSALRRSEGNEAALRCYAARTTSYVSNGRPSPMVSPRTRRSGVVTPVSAKRRSPTPSTTGKMTSRNSSIRRCSISVRTSW